LSKLRRCHVSRVDQQNVVDRLVGSAVVLHEPIDACQQSGRTTTVRTALRPATKSGGGCLALGSDACRSFSISTTRLWVASVVLSLAALVAASSTSSDYAATEPSPTTAIEASGPTSPASTPGLSSSTTETAVDTTDVSHLAGRCITITNDRLEGVASCTSPHDARVVVITTNTDDCPSSADAYFRQETTVLCVDQTSTESVGLPSGLFCRDVKAEGGNYEDSVNYYIAEGRPARMDEDGNGIPCETVYSKREVQEYLEAYGSP